MTGLIKAITEFESKGGEFALEGNQVQVEYPPEQEATLAPVLATLRAHREAVARLIRERASGIPAPAQCPPLPSGVRLVKYAPKAAPVAIQPCSVVTDVNKFICSYLRDLQFRLEHPKVNACAPLHEILAKLAEVGVELEIDAGRQR